MNKIKESIISSVETKLKIASDNEFLVELERIGNRMITVLKMGGKILIAGNGGSAADAQHFVAELAGKFIYERKGLPAIALTTNSSIITAIGNDFGYEYIFSRQVEGLGQQGDIFVGISTSGNSQNLIQAMQSAQNIGITTVGLLGKDGGLMKELCNLKLIVPSQSTQHIQEAHIMIIHELCAIIDNAFKNHK
ncbi:MAG: phosphoheptose isomerase [Candidatus Yanofskybacteria bacterium RIFCSPHIGHO2_02_FULL_43_22]|uniref:Phosphoheptose isomerase n=1 Tax=Candidatus Yanofskybacteria bacterium RIFCSPHIGHO2_02_FULL_43_22 TaxID=1802681 RepID=A0A1F8FS79_9BACT|nr:MAG: phosphoheptose isomerase [Candidatus Yanofskybacteria bacterium RIFCSPHIGHO2_02_FULL_43_22]